MPNQEAVLSLIQTIGQEIVDEIVPLIEKDYPDIDPDDVRQVFSSTTTNLAAWLLFMRMHVLPIRRGFQVETVPPEQVEKVPLPQLIPGLTLQPVPAVTFNYVITRIKFYLNTYDAIEAQWKANHKRT